MTTHTKLDTPQQRELLTTLANRFGKNMPRHPHVSWDNIYQKLLQQPEKLWSLSEMERTGGEPDLVQFDEQTKKYIFIDCSTESPTGRRSLCFDDQALLSRKANKPRGSALGMAAEMGIELLTEEQYRYLQTLGEFDTKTSSWIATPVDIRSLGGAMFSDRRYNQTFIYHNGAESYYAARGFRGTLLL